MHRKKNGQPEAREVANQGAEAIDVIDVLRAMEGGEDEATGFQPELGQQTRPLLGRGHQPRRGVNDGVAGESNAFIRDALRTQVLAGLVGGRQTQVREMVSDDAVVLLRHATVEAAQSCLDVDERNLEGVGRQGPSQCRVGVTLHDDDCRSSRGELLFETLHQLADLPRPALSADGQHDTRGRQLEIFEHRAGHQIVEVLSREDCSRAVAQQVDDAGQLDDLGPCPEHDGHRSRVEDGFVEVCRHGFSGPSGRLRRLNGVGPSSISHRRGASIVDTASC
jgi:hypothetical protein